MPTSGQTLWELQRNQLISAALRKLGALSEGQIPSTEDFTNGTVALNGIIASFQTIGMPLWKRQETYISLQENTESYTIGEGQTINVPFPLKVQQAYLVNNTTGQQIEIETKSYFDWQQVRTYNASSFPVFVSYTPYINFGILNVWPIPDASAATNYSIMLVNQRPFEDMVDAADSLDFPKEWHNAIIYELAVTLAPEYGASSQERQDLKQDAKKWLDMAKDFGTDETSIFFQIERRQ